MRALIRLCFRRPVAVSSVTALLVVLSVVAYVRLPKAAKQPVVLRINPSERPIMMLALHDAARDTAQARPVAAPQDNLQDLSRLRDVRREVELK